MKKKYEYVDQTVVRDSRAIAKILIRNTYDNQGTFTKKDINQICFIVCQLFDARQMEFILDFKEWIKEEIIKFNSKIEK